MRLRVYVCDQVATLREQASTDAQRPDQAEVIAGLKRTVASLQVTVQQRLSLISGRSLALGRLMFSGLPKIAGRAGADADGQTRCASS